MPAEAQKLAREWLNKRSTETAESATAGVPQDTEAITEAAQDFEAEKEAYQRGDNTAALGEFSTL